MLQSKEPGFRLLDNEEQSAADLAAMINSLFSEVAADVVIKLTDFVVDWEDRNPTYSRKTSTDYLLKTAKAAVMRAIRQVRETEVDLDMLAIDHQQCRGCYYSNGDCVCHMFDRREEDLD